MKEKAESSCISSRKGVKIMNNKLINSIGLGALTLGTLFMFAQNSYAYKGDPAKVGPNYTVQRHEAMEKAFENNDYNAWKELMGTRGRVTQVVNANNFSQFAKAHELAEQGKVAEANKIRAELGLGLNNGAGNGMGKYQSNR